jgi:DNA-directed RNA polymerase subunit RPC12/RpoP
MVMRLVALQCPSCAASLEIEDGIDTCYCSYCGFKIIMDGQSTESVKAKVRLKQMEHEERLKDKEFAQERYKIQHEAKESRRGTFASWLGGAAIFTMIVIMVGGVYLKSVHREAELQEIVDAIGVDIANGDYDSALIKANSLYYDVNWSSETESKWDNVRKTLIETIESKTKAKVPESSKKLKGKNYQDVIAGLQAAGFTSITTAKLTDLVNGWVTKDGEVEKVSINGVSDFKADASFPKDAEIVISYHTFP